MKFFKTLLILPLFLLTGMVFQARVNALNINESIYLKKDNSGAITLTYFEKDAVVKASNNMIGNFPFTKDKINEYFNTTNSKVQDVKIEPRPNDPGTTQVTVTISFTDINKLPLMKAFANTRVSFEVTDTGKVFKHFITPEFISTNKLNNSYMAMVYDDKYISSNGKQNGEKGVIWFRGKEYIDGKSDIYYTGTFYTDEKTGTTSSGNNESNNKSGGCGLFGIELPLILIGGLGLTAGLRNIKRK